MQQESGGRLSAAALKWIAAAAMTADHIGIVFGAALPEWAAACLRIAGRVSLPLFCFFVAEGARRTRSRGKYALRLLAFAFASEIPFDLMLSGRPFDPLCQNVLFTLLFGLLAVWAADSLRRRPAYAVLCVLALSAAAQLGRTDYGLFGVWIVLLFWLLPEDTPLRAVLLCTALFFAGAGMGSPASGLWQLAGALALPLLKLYGGGRGRGGKYTLYIYYPLHMLALYLLSLL